MRNRDGGWLRPLPALLGVLVTKVEDMIDRSGSGGLEMRKRAWEKQHDGQNSANPWDVVRPSNSALPGLDLVRTSHCVYCRGARKVVKKTSNKGI